MDKPTRGMGTNGGALTGKKQLLYNCCRHCWKALADFYRFIRGGMWAYNVKTNINIKGPFTSIRLTLFFVFLHAYLHLKKALKVRVGNPMGWQPTPIRRQRAQTSTKSSTCCSHSELLSSKINGNDDAQRTISYRSDASAIR